MSFEFIRPKDDDFFEIRSIRFTFKDIHNVVDAFYKEVAVDPLLSVPFGSVKDWPHHIESLTHFWWTRFGGRAYMDVSYNPVGKHFEAGFNEEFLKRWLALFKATLDKTLSPAQSELWEAISISMGSALSKNNELMKQHHSKR